MIVTIKQRTDAWLEWRKGGIGGSDAGTIMGENPFASPHELWAEKTGLRAPKKVNQAMQRGIDLERDAMDALAQHLGEFLPPACLQHDEQTFMLTSLDGYAPPDLAVEVKCPTMPRIHLITRDGCAPELYRAQCQHNLYVSGCRMLIFASYYPEDKEVPLAVVNVLRDEGYLTRLIAAEREFWGRVQTKTWPKLRLVGER